MPRRKVILALDLGAKCGWALWKDGKVSSGTWKLVKSTTKKHTERHGMRFVRLQEQLELIHREIHIDAIFYEEVHAHAGTDAAHAYGGYRSHAMSWCETANMGTPVWPEPVLYGSFGVGTIKKRATGKGNSKKDKMIAAANRLWKGKKKVTDDNEADALWILVLATERLGLRWPGGKP